MGTERQGAYCGAPSGADRADIGDVRRLWRGAWADSQRAACGRDEACAGGKYPDADKESHHRSDHPVGLRRGVFARHHRRGTPCAGQDVQDAVGLVARGEVLRTDGNAVQTERSDFHRLV